jgi:ABC-type transport system substrate-binding protein
MIHAMTTRRQAALIVAASPLAASAAPPAQRSPAGAKVLRIANLSETGFDPARTNDAPSGLINSHIFEPLLGYDPLARPVKLRPLTAAAMPESSADFRVWTVRLRPGILFAPNAAFGGRPRELVAADCVFSFMRLADPANRSAAWSGLEQSGISGLAARRREAVDGKKPFDYSRPIEGLLALDRYTLRFTLDAGRPRFAQQLADGATGAVAHEVIAAHGDLSVQNPVGTGPFRLVEWRRASRIVLERNPVYREVFYDAQPAADDTWGQETLARLRGRRLPMVDRVEVAVMDESQPTWLAFLNDEIDYIVLPPEFTPMALPAGRVAPHLAKRGVRAELATLPSTYYTMFNMEHPLVGGYAPAQVALRRAIALGIDVGREIDLLREGSAVLAQSPITANMSGFDANYRSEMGTYDPARARALLDLYGWRDSNRDGWRETPDGEPLVLEMATQPNQQTRRYDELMKRDMNALGLRVDFRAAQWPEQYKAARAGKLMLWSVTGRASSPDGLQGFLRYDGAASGGINLSRFNLPQMNQLIQRLLALPDGPDRDAGFLQAKRLAAVWMPYKLRTHPVQATLMHSRVVGFRRPLFSSNWFDQVDVRGPAGAA